MEDHRPHWFSSWGIIMSFFNSYLCQWSCQKSKHLYFFDDIVLIFTTITFNNKFSGIETPLDVVYYKSEEKNAILKK